MTSVNGVHGNGAGPIFQPLTINGVEFPNRLVRSSIGGRLAFYDGTVNPAWGRFERRFADELLVLVDGGYLRQRLRRRAVRALLDVPLHHVDCV